MDIDFNQNGKRTIIVNSWDTYLVFLSLLEVLATRAIYKASCHNYLYTLTVYYSSSFSILVEDYIYGYLIVT